MTAKTTRAANDAEQTKRTQTQTEEAFAPTTRANANADVDTEAARLEYRLQGKAGYDRVLAALKKEQSTLRETRQYLFGRLLNLQLEEAVLRDHLNLNLQLEEAARRDHLNLNLQLEEAAPGEDSNKRVEDEDETA